METVDIMNKIYNEDYKVTIPKLSNIKMVITSPPDAEEIGLKPTSIEYKKFIEDFIDNITKVSNLICVVMTDRKSKGVIQKHTYLTYNFLEIHGFNLLSHKIWVRSLKSNLFRLTYTHIMVFSKGSIKQAHYSEYEPDVWEIPSEKRANSFPVELIKRVVKNFTSRGDLVFDPFMGTGATAVALKEEGRNYVGSELYEEIYKECMERIENE